MTTARRFEFSGGTSNKFWEVSVDGCVVRTTYGRIGSAGQTSLKTEASPEKAQGACEKLIREKLAKGYVEIGASQVPAAVAAPKQKSPSGKIVTVKTGGAKYVVALRGARCVVLDGANVVTWFDSRGKELGTKKVPNPGTPRAAPDGHVVIVSEKTVLELDEGRLVKDLKLDVPRAVPLANGGIVTLSRDGTTLALTPPGGEPKGVIKPKGKVTFLLAARDGFFFTEKLDGSEKRLAVCDAAGKEREELRFKASRHSAPVELADGRVAVAGDDKVFITPKKVVKLPAPVAAPLVRSGETLAAPVEGGVVALIDAKGKLVSVRRDAPGAGQNEARITHGPGGTFVLPSIDGTVHHVSAKGEFLGSVTLGSRLALKSEAATLDDGTFVVADASDTLHFFGAEHFGAASAPVVKDMSAQKKELRAHFAPWLATPQCEQVLEALLERVADVKREGKAMRVDFITDESSIFSVQFGPPGRREPAMPESYNTAVALHGEVVLGEGVPDDIHFGTCNAEEEAERFIGLCDAGQNWLVFDTKKKNKLGEPSIALFDHGAALEDAEPYPSQQRVAFGVPGHLLRCIAYRVLENDERFSEFNWG